MNHAATIAGLALAASLTLAGCSSQEWANRAEDWAQVFTLTVGDGVGVKARIGPAQLGLYKGEDRAGLRAGEWGSSWHSHDNYDYLWLFYGKECFTGWETTRTPLQAKKVTAATHVFPLLVERRAPSPHGFVDLYGDSKYENGAHNAAYWTQFDLAVGVGGSVRLGFNPGELLDAILGHVGIDIYRDDIAESRVKRVSDEERRAQNPILNSPDTLPITSSK